MLLYNFLNLQCSNISGSIFYPECWLHILHFHSGSKNSVSHKLCIKSFFDKFLIPLSRVHNSQKEIFISHQIQKIIAIKYYLWLCVFTRHFLIFRAYATCDNVKNYVWQYKPHIMLYTRGSWQKFDVQLKSFLRD